MKNIRFIALFLITSFYFITVSAQYTAMIGGKNEKGQITDYTPLYFATKKGLFQSGYYLQFQKTVDTLYVYASYAAWSLTELNSGDISSIVFLFRDGSELTLPATENFKKESTPVIAGGITGSWTNYPVRSKISQEQIDIFSKKSLISIAINFKRVGEFDAFVPEEKSIYIAMNVEYFLSRKVVSKKDIVDRFNKTETNKIYNDEKWDF